MSKSLTTTSGRGKRGQKITICEEFGKSEKKDSQDMLSSPAGIGAVEGDGYPYDIFSEHASYNSLRGAQIRLLKARPILIQEEVASDPWKLLVAVKLLNVTTGRAAIPVFRTLMERWPTPKRMAKADLVELSELLKPLGLWNKRTTEIKAISYVYYKDPPANGMDRVHSTLRKYPPTPISHLPFCGQYALDSYRIFCGKKDEWKSVLPKDKELIKYLKWKHAVFDGAHWDPLLGVTRAIHPQDISFLNALASQLEGWAQLMQSPCQKGKTTKKRTPNLQPS